MVKRNLNFDEFQNNYLFVEIANRRQALQKAIPHAKIISLGIGDTTEPITPIIAESFINKVNELTTREGYTGYPAYNGTESLRQAIADNIYKDTMVTADEVFISDGSKPDLARLQLLFPPETTIAVQDPVYPAYVDGSVLSGKAGKYDKATESYERIVYMRCNPENNFFPDLDTLPRTDLIFFCSPNNPTGACVNREQLAKLVEFARRNSSIIIFDSAYREFISDSTYPKSIYEIEGADEVAFEICSLSKSIGFTGIRLGWTVCPHKLTYSDNTPVYQDWARIMSTCFNGANSIAERGAVASLSLQGLKEMTELVNYYMTNARLIRQSFLNIGLKCYGGFQGPYIWIRVPFMTSWEIFQFILDNAHVVVTPGAGFGHEGHNFIRISSFAHREDVEEALTRLIPAFKKLMQLKGN